MGFLVALGCFLGAASGNVLAFPGSGTAILFPPYAIVTAALLTNSTRSWPIFLVAASLGNFGPHHAGGAPVSFVLMTELANHVRALTAAMGIRRWSGAKGRFDSLRGMGVFLLFAAVVGPLVGAWIGATAVMLHGRSTDFRTTIREWFLSNTTTGLTLLPILLVKAAPGSLATLRASSARRWVEGASLVLLLLGVGHGVLLQPTSGWIALPVYAPLPLLLWAALRFGPQGTSAGLLVVVVLTIAGVLAGLGPFGPHSPWGDLAHVQLFLLATSVPLLLLSALVREHRWTASALGAESERAVEANRLLAAERSSADALRRADLRKDEALAVVAHELRNPLAPIAMVLEVLRQEESNNTRLRRVRELIDRQVGQMSRLIEDLLDVSRMTGRKIEVTMSKIDVARALEVAVEMSLPKLQARRIALRFEAGESPLWIAGDAVRIAQIASNLLNNAAKYAPPGGRVDLTAAREGSEIVVRCADDGAGIPREMLDRIFDTFVQVDRARDGKLGGLGLGLALVKHLTEVHGGKASARSEGPGTGAEFLIRLPAWRVPGPTSPSFRRGQSAAVDERADGRVDPNV